SALLHRRTRGTTGPPIGRRSASAVRSRPRRSGGGAVRGSDEQVGGGQLPQGRHRHPRGSTTGSRNTLRVAVRGRRHARITGRGAFAAEALVAERGGIRGRHGGPAHRRG